MATFTWYFITYKLANLNFSAFDFAFKLGSKIIDYVPDESSLNQYDLQDLSILFKDYELTKYIDLLELLRKFQMLNEI